MPRSSLMPLAAASVGLSLGAAPALAFNFTLDEQTQGAWVTNVTAGVGFRAKSANCNLVGDPNASGAAGCGGNVNTAQWSNGDDGNLNYRKGQAYTGYLSVTSELLLTRPADGLKFLGRGTALYDPLANRTERSALSREAKDQIVHEAKVLDLWVQKDFRLFDRGAYLRLGNQVLNWGESTFASGGINATNALDWQKLLVPGTQLKQALLPAPMLTFGSDIASGWSTQAYLQFDWNANRYAPVGGYWSVTDLYGRGATVGYTANDNYNVGGLENTTTSTAYPYTTVRPGRDPQFGLRLNYKPSWTEASFSAYYLHYTDKAPVLTYLADGSGQWSFLKNRQLFGLSSNFTLGDWAVGAEASYRPRDAVALSPCYGSGGATDLNSNGIFGADCAAYTDRKKLQFDVTAQKYLTRSSDPWLAAIAADQATFTGELTWIRYPGVSDGAQYGRTVGGQSAYQVVQAAYGYWLRNDATLGTIAAAQGTANSGGLALDFNATYDGSLVPGWAVTPGVTFYASLFGYTPSFSANYLKGARSANLYVLFNQNPAVWQAGVNYTAFWGGNAISQPYSDRNTLGAFVTRNF